jgi:hypothetical protein
MNVGSLLQAATGPEAEHFRNRIATGMLVGAPTSASTQVTGTGASDFNANISAGILAVDGVVREYAAQADYAIATSAAQQMAAGQSRVYTVVAYINPADGLPALRVVAGAAATTGDQVAPTDAVIGAEFADNVPWYRVAEVTVNRTADTTITQSANNAVRPSGIPIGAHRP